MKANKKMHVRVVRPHKLTSSQVEQMCELYLAHHHTERNACRERITSGFDRIALFECAKTKRVVGFNGMRIKKHRIEGFRRPIRSLYLGQMFVEPSFRSRHPIHRACLAALWPVLVFQPWYHCIVWGDALTYKPFLLIAHTAETYFPHPEMETPAPYKALIDHLGQTHYGENYDPETGCVTKDKKLIMEHVAPIDHRLLRNPLIRFYAEKNKNYQQGHGLLVMMDFSWAAATTIFRKVYKRIWSKSFSQFSLPSFLGVPQAKG